MRRFPAVFSAAALSVLLLWAADLSAAPELPLPHYHFAVCVDDERGVVAGEVVLTFANRTRDHIRRLPLVLYPNSLARPGADLNDVNYPLRYPGGFSAGGMTLERVTSQGREAHFSLAGETHELAWVSLPDDGVAPGETVELTVEFTTRIPERFGTFGRVEERIILLGGWHPALPRLGPDGFVVDEVAGAWRYDGEVRFGRAGAAVVGKKMIRARAGKRHTISGRVSGPLLLAWSREFGLARSSPAPELLLVTGRRDALRSRRTREVLAAARSGLAQFPASVAGSSPFLLVEAPLRESLVVPFAGGVLYSDYAFALFPVEKLTQQHRDTLRAAVFAAHLLTESSMDLYGALLTINLVQFLRWEQGRSDPVFLRRFFRQTEFWGALDTMGTDPQAHFQSAMFFTPRLSPDLARSYSLFRRKVASPRTAARLLFNHFGVGAVTAALARTRERGTAILDELLAEATAKEGALLEALLSPRAVDLSLDSVEPQPGGGWQARICKDGDETPFPVELHIRDDEPGRTVTVACPEACCTVPLPPSRRPPRLHLDPYGVFLQESEGANDPRRNDRNTLDLKWIINKPYLTFAGGDRLPTMGVELMVQPRFDLRNRFYLQPGVSPERVSVSTGWRRSFGRRIRPNYLAHSLLVALRATAGINGDSGTSFGPAVTWLYSDRQSRFNPFSGNVSYLYAFPVVEADFDGLGLRFGGLTSQVWGRSPDHVLATRLNVDGTVGKVPSWDVPASGGLEGLRGASTMGLSRHQRLSANLEYRWMITRNLNVSMARLAYLTGVQLALFVDGADLADDIVGLGRPESLFLDVGAGLRSHFNVLGALPGLVGLDVAWLLPVGGMESGGWNFVLAFYQPF